MNKFLLNKQLLSYWLIHHSESFRKSFARILANPLEFIFTTLMIAIAFAIPLSMFIIFQSTAQLADQWDSDKQITLFLKKDIDIKQANTLAKKISQFDEINDALVIDKNTALEEFSKQSGMNALATGLNDNPLPHIIIANPNKNIVEFSSLQALEEKLNHQPQVELVQFDLLWFQRLQAILNVVNKISWMISIVLLIAIGLIITNVIRWEVSSRHSEIEIIKLIGGSDAYVRRPFLYTGFWLGIIGAVLAFITVTTGSWIIQHSTQILASLFDSDYRITTLSVGNVAALFICAAILGIGSAWIAVTHKLKEFC